MYAGLHYRFDIEAGQAIGAVPRRSHLPAEPWSPEGERDRGRDVARPHDR